MPSTINVTQCCRDLPGETMRPYGKRLWSWSLAVPLAVFLLWWALRGADWSVVWHSLLGARWQYLAATALFTPFSFFLRSLRWRILLNAEENLSVGEVFYATMAGYLGNAFLPARAGELVRTVVVSGRSSLTKTYVLTTALSERLADMIALVLWASVILLGVHPKPGWMTGAARIMAVAAGGAAITIAILPHTGGWCQKLLHHVHLPHGIRDRLTALIDQVLLGMRAFHHTGRFLGFAAFTVLIWVSDACGTMVAAYALRIDMSFSMTMLLLAGLGLGSALPSTPGYVGIYQFVAVTVLGPLGIAKSEALAFIVTLQACGYITTLVLGLAAVSVLRSPSPVSTSQFIKRVM